MFETLGGFLFFHAILLVLIVLFWGISGLALKFDWSDNIFIGFLSAACITALIFQATVMSVVI